ncbi:cell division protein FtsZ [Lampropedia puyangensis]|uniref:Cell division protein FtsZ n=1 Tax=Lampropedia puyangensis TaxID=1330072 RepID=A0A4S8FB91_9BURK|nr:cell division protein FtsZ [Lampropedia puyangensis]THU02862.1 cell division protein FtsZ [Lampropedia puyangensis]
MSTLQTTFIILGVVIVLAVIGYNAWYSATYAPRKARPVSDEDADKPQAPASNRREPSLAGEIASLNNVDDTAHAQEPLLNTAATNNHKGGLFGKGKAPSSMAPAEEPVHQQEAAPSAGLVPPAQVLETPSQLSSTPLAVAAQEFDSLVFSVVPLELEKTVSGDAALAALPPTRRIGKKQFLIQGLNQQNHLWESPRAGARYSQFQAAIQLANRQGPLNEIEFSEFVLKTQEFADAIGASPDFPDMLHEVARGREVDHFAAQNDAILNLMLVAQRATWSPGYVRQTAAQFGFKSSVTPGRLILPAASPNSPPVLVLNYDPQAAMADDLDHAPVHEILFSLDVPNVDRSENAYERLRSILDSMAQTMEGAVTDPEGRKLPAMAIESIGADMERIYDALEARGFPAGSPSALKLFS